MQRNAAWAIAIALGVAGLGLQLAPAALAPAASCPGLLERAAIAAAEIARDAPLGLWLLRIDRVVFFLTIVVFGRAAFEASGSWLAAAAVTLAFAARPAFAPTMSPFDPFTAGAASLAAYLALRRLDVREGLPWGGVLCVVAIACAVPLVPFPGWSMPPLPPSFNGVVRTSCLLPPGRFADVLPALIDSIGRYGIVLAAFGLFSLRARLLDRRSWPLIGYVAVAFAVASIGGTVPDRALAPAVVAVWLLSAVGLAEVVRAAGVTSGGPIGAALLAVLVPVVPIAARSGPPHATSPLAATLGHDRMSLDGIRRTIQLLPGKSVLVEEDATLDVLLRASSGTWQRSGKALRIVAAEPALVSAAAGDAAWRVFALPVAQTNLSLLGFELAGNALPGVSGVSQVTKGGVCKDVGEAWMPIEFAPAAPMLVLRSEHPEEGGAVAIWLGSTRPIGLMPVGWPAWVAPGFLPVSYAAGERERARQDGVSDGLTGREPVFDEPDIVRLEIWKVADAPRLLPFSLGAGRPSMGLIHATPGMTLQLCPGYQESVQPIALPR